MRPCRPQPYLACTHDTIKLYADNVCHAAMAAAMIARTPAMIPAATTAQQTAPYATLPAHSS